MAHRTARSRSRFKLVIAALGVAALAAPTASRAQTRHVDFVAQRVELAQPALAACVTSINEPRPGTNPLVEVTIRDRNVTLATVTPDTSPAWRTCIENALRGALVISAGQARSLPRTEGFMTVGIALGTPGPSTQPAAPSYAAGQRVRILWGSSWYDGTIVAVVVLSSTQGNVLTNGARANTALCRIERRDPDGRWARWSIRVLSAAS